MAYVIVFVSLAKLTFRCIECACSLGVECVYRLCRVFQDQVNHAGHAARPMTSQDLQKSGEANAYASPKTVLFVLDIDFDIFVSKRQVKVAS